MSQVQLRISKNNPLAAELSEAFRVMSDREINPETGFEIRRAPIPGAMDHAMDLLRRALAHEGVDLDRYLEGIKTAAPAAPSPADVLNPGMLGPMLMAAFGGAPGGPIPSKVREKYTRVADDMIRKSK